MQVAVLIVALVSGVATAMFIVSGLRRAMVRHQALGVRALVLTTVCSVATGVFTIWQLVLVVQELRVAR